MADLTPEEKARYLAEFRARKKKPEMQPASIEDDILAGAGRSAGPDGPGAPVPVGQGLVTDSTEGALNKIADVSGALIDEYDRRSQIDLPENVIAGQKLPPMKFSPVMGTVKSVKKGVKELSDADFAKMYGGSPTGVSGRLGESLPGGGGTMGHMMPKDATRFERKQFLDQEKEGLQNLINERRADAVSPQTVQELVEQAELKDVKNARASQVAKDVNEVVGKESSGVLKQFPTAADRAILKAKKQLHAINTRSPDVFGLSEKGAAKVRQALEEQIKKGGG